VSGRAIGGGEILVAVKKKGGGRCGTTISKNFMQKSKLMSSLWGGKTGDTGKLVRGKKGSHKEELTSKGKRG